MCSLILKVQTFQRSKMIDSINHWHINKLKNRKNVFFTQVKVALAILTYIPPKRSLFLAEICNHEFLVDFFLFFTFFGPFTPRESPKTLKKPSGLLIQKKSLFWLELLQMRIALTIKWLPPYFRVIEPNVPLSNLTAL